MAQPFFGIGQYPWDLEEARSLHRELYTAIRTADKIIDIYESCSAELDPLEEKPARQMWRDALSAIAVAGLLPVLGERLGALKLPKVNKAFKTAADLPDLIMAPVLSSNRIFVNRETLRAEVDRMGKLNSASGVLLVRGPGKSGKTWTHHVIVEQAKSLGDKPFLIVAGMFPSVEGVIGKIFDILDGEVPAGLSTDPAWYSTVCSKMIRFAEKGKYRRYWIIVDDLQRMDQNIRRFFEQAVLNMVDDAFSSRFRLVLIDYPEGPVPVNWIKGYWAEEVTAEADIKADVLSTFLSNWAVQKKKLLTDVKAKEEAAKLLARVGTPAPPNDTRPYLERVHDELTALLGSL